MATKTKPLIRYVERDYDSFLQAMLDLISQKAPEWTDTSSSDMGRVLLELFAWAFDVLAYYQDVQANEAFLDTATQRKSVVNLCKLIGYELKLAKAAKTFLTFTFVPQPTSVVIPKGFQVATVPVQGEEEIIFETSQDVVLAAGQTQISVEAVEGRSINRELIGISNQTPNQTFTLKQTPVIRDSVRIAVDEGYGEVLWTEVETFIDSKPNDLHYTLFPDENDQVHITFGNDISGKIPAFGAKIYAYYRIGGGSKGNVGANTLIKPKMTLPGLISVTNPSAATGGEDKESIEQARKNAPRSLRTMWRAVTVQDFQDLAESVEGVGKVRILPGYTWATNHIEVYIAPETGGLPSAELKAKVAELLNERKLLTVMVDVKDPSYIGVSVSATVTVQPNYLQSTVRSAVQQAIEQLLAFKNRDFGQPLYRAELIETIMGVDGVKNVVLTQPEQDVEIESYQIIQLSGPPDLTMVGGVAG